MFPSEQTRAVCRAGAPDKAVQEDGVYVISGNVFEGGTGRVSGFGTSTRDPDAIAAGTIVTRRRAA